MKFQNPSLIFFNGRTDAQTHAWTSRNQNAPNFFKVGGIQTETNLHVTGPNRKIGSFRSKGHEGKEGNY